MEALIAAREKEKEEKWKKAAKGPAAAKGRKAKGGNIIQFEREHEFNV